MKNVNFDSLIFSEFRTAVIADPKAELNETSLLKAMTVNSELINLGYTLSPADTITLSKSESLNVFPSYIRGMIGDVKAAPMYPNFPDEVMKLSEAQFRFHQMLHYMSTYGVEEITGHSVSKGWLPESDAVDKRVEDTVLLNAKVIGLVDESEKYSFALKKILSKAERMTDKEREIVKIAAKSVPLTQLTDLTVKFKQNLLDVFYIVFEADISVDLKKAILYALCQHTGDVWKCVDYVLTKHKFHLKTSQKRLIVKLFESYPEADFKANIILSNKKAERIKLILNFIDYNTYSRSAKHKAVVESLRADELKSWDATANELAEAGSEELVSYLAQRPGVLLRKVAFLVRKGYETDKIKKTLVDVSEDLSMQTLISILTFFGKKEWPTPERTEEAGKVYSICETAFADRAHKMVTPLKDKKVFVDPQNLNLELSTIECKDKSSEGGYIRSGLAVKIPDNVDRIRFFVYWNDERRVDVDLHGFICGPNGDMQHIGWNGEFRASDKKVCAIFSGDITHSNAAEYIDFIMDPDRLSSVHANVNLYSGAANFGDIDECYVGLMAVDKLGKEVKLYNPANCFFAHHLTSKDKDLRYGYIDVQNRVIVFKGSPASSKDDDYKVNPTSFSLKRYLDLLLEGQNAVLVDKRENADCVLVMEKPSDTNEISLLDANFFVEEE